MQPVVYIDVLFVINFIIDYMLLYTTGKICKIKMSTIRIIIAALVGAIYAVLMFFTAFKIYYTFIAKILFSMALIAIAYNISKFKNFLKVFMMFYVVSFAFGGAAIALFYFTNVGAFIGAVQSNGVIYFNLPWKTLILSCIIAYIAIRISWNIYRKKLNKENMYVNLVVVFDNKKKYIDALLDTGNLLYDPLTNLPVIIVEFQAIRDLFPKDVQDIFEGSKESDLNFITKVMNNSSWMSRFRMIPFSSLGNENGMLIGFKADEIEVIDHNKNKSDLKDIVVGVYNNKLSNDEKYKALLHPEIILNE